MPRAADASPAPSRAGWCAGAVLAIAVLAAYANTLGAPFVYDDTLAIPENPTIRKLWPLSEVLLPHAEGGLTVSGRPILNLSFALNYAVSGTAVWSYHLVNALIHAGAALLLFGIVRRTLVGRGAGLLRPPSKDGQGAARLRPDGSSDSSGRPAQRGPEWFAFAVAAFWGLHPLLTQAVTYTVQRAESLMGFFYLLTLYAFVRAVESRGGATSAEAGAPPPSVRTSRRGVPTQRCRWFAMSVVACVLGMGTKEVMATAPLLVWLYDRTFVAGTFRAAWRERRGYYGALAATWLVLGALVWSTGGNRGGTVGLGVGLPIWAYPLTQFEAVARYLALSVWPHPLVFEYGTFWVRRASEALPYALIVLPLLVLTGVALWRGARHEGSAGAPAGAWRVGGFLGACFFLILAPTSLAPGTIQMIVEHRMYLPLAAVATGLMLVLHRAVGARARWAVGLSIAALLVLAVRRNHDYRSHVALWTDTVAKRPLNPRAHEGLAEALTEAGRLEEAIQVRQRSVGLLPDESQYHYNLAMTLTDAGRSEEAVQHYRESLRLFPNEARTHNNLAILLAKLGRHAEALPHYAEAVRLRPDDPLYHYNHGIALMRERRWADAAASYEAALRARPDYADAHFNLAAALLKLGQNARALERYAAAVKLKPDDAEYASTYGSALLLAGRPEDALAQFQRALSRAPNSIEALNGAGNALASLRRYDEAVAHYQAVLRRAPDHASAHYKLGNALLDLDRVPEAIPHYAAAVKLSPQDAEAHHNLGIAFARLERWEDARRAFDEALRLKPDYADARRSREQLRALLGR